MALTHICYIGHGERANTVELLFELLLLAYGKLMAADTMLSEVETQVWALSKHSETAKLADEARKALYKFKYALGTELDV